MSRALVMGPGRSGSQYLAQVVNDLGFETIHEITRKFRGDGRYLEDCDWEGAGEWLKGEDRRALCGFPYGFMVYYLRHVVGDLRVICVYRELEPWLPSATGNFGGVDKAKSFPRGLTDMTHYWNTYNHLMDSVTPPVLRLKMNELDACKPRIEELLT